MSNLLKLVKPAELCEALGVCRKTLTRYEEQGLIRPVKINGRVFRYDPEEIGRLIENLKGKVA